MADSFLHLPVEDRREALGLVGDDGEALPKTRSEERRWTSEVRKSLLIQATSNEVDFENAVEGGRECGWRRGGNRVRSRKGAMVLFEQVFVVAVWLRLRVPGQIDISLRKFHIS